MYFSTLSVPCQYQLEISNFDLSVCLEQTNQRPLCVMGDSPQCGEMSAEQTKGLARSVPPKAVGDCFSLYYQSLRHFVTPPLTRTPKAHCIHFGEPRTQGRLIFNFHKLLDKSQVIARCSHKHRRGALRAPVQR